MEHGIVLRTMEDADKSFIYSTWLKGTYYGNDFMNSVVKEVFFREYSKYIDNLLQKSLVIVACLVDDQSVILGYSVSRQNVLDFVFVKAAWRRKGIANSVVPKEINTVTTITKSGNSIRLKKGWSFNPWLL